MFFFPYHLIDLTHVLEENIPSWDGKCGFAHTTLLDYAECATGVPFKVQQFNMLAGIGTHMDAPAHCVKSGKTINQITLDTLIAPCFVIDVSQRAHEHYMVSQEDIELFEHLYGCIPAKSFVMIKTGWERFWHQPEQYRNNYQFPCVNQEAAEYLVQKKVVGIGIDTLSPDRPESGYGVHQLLLSNDIYIIENAAYLARMPIVGSFVMVVPLNIKGATESPVRLIGLIPQ